MRSLPQLLAAIKDRWAVCTHDPEVWGRQIQRGARWLPGLSDQEIAEFQQAVSLKFPDQLVEFLRLANGTDRPAMHRFRNGEPEYDIGVRSYPRDLDEMKSCISALAEDWPEILDEMDIPGATLDGPPPLLPIYAHRYVLCNGDPHASQVFSIHGADIIIYADSLPKYLEAEFLRPR